MSPTKAPIPPRQQVALTPATAEFWVLAIAMHPDIDADRLTDVFAFDDDADGAAFCAAAVLSGEKTATSALAADFGPDRSIPRAGDLGIVTEYDGTPRAVIAYTDVDRIRFGDVDAGFAIAEGDGDLAAWRATHLCYYGARCSAHGVALTEETELLRLFFHRVYP
ncbi:MAG TPA: ASCH domain-containing protein [Thermohalobaculum sp.]|nr:ASCH domain-containing protein [Thermohalobaculum sp.]